MPQHRRPRCHSLSAAVSATSILLSGCATSRQPELTVFSSGPLVRDAAAQVRRCYRTPRVATVGKQITTKLRVLYAGDGSLVSVPAILSQSGVTPDNRPYAAKMAEAAGLAVIRCAPLKLPATDSRRILLDFTFSPVARG